MFNEAAKKVFEICERKGLFDILDDRAYIRLMYRVKTGNRIRINNPKTFNEKLQWLKLYDRNPLYSTMVDKYEVKEYVSAIIGSQYVIPSVGVYDSFDEIVFEDIPDQFVVKCTHDSGGLFVCKNKRELNINALKSKITKCMCTNYYKRGREWPYKRVKPRIIIEQYMEDGALKELRDYKFFCFNGEPLCYKVDFDRFKNHRANYYDMSSKLMCVGEVVCPPDHSRVIDPPRHLDQMAKFAKQLSNGISFVRVDFYEVNEKVYFGELTFYPASGFGKFIYEGNDEMLGSWLELPSKKVEEINMIEKAVKHILGGGNSKT